MLAPMRLLLFVICIWGSVFFMARGQGPAANQPSGAIPKPTAQPVVPAKPVEQPPIGLVFEMTDGSRFIGTVSPDARVKIKTAYSEVEVQLGFVNTIDFNDKHAAHASLQGGDVLNGDLITKEIELKTGVGKMTIPLAQVREIKASASDAPTSAAPAGKAPDDTPVASPAPAVAAPVSNVPPNNNTPASRAPAIALLPSGLVLHYAFDTNEGKRVVDSSNSKNDGTVRNVEYSKDGKRGGAMHFSGPNQIIVAKNDPSLQLQDFTIMAWVKVGDKEPAPAARGTVDGVMLASGGDAVMIWTERQGTGAQHPTTNLIFSYGQSGYGFGLREGGHPFLTQVGVSNVTSSKCVVPADGNYHHVAVTKGKDNVVFYLDGVAFPANSYGPVFEFNTEPAVGNRADAMESWFLGLIDELAVFDRPLSAEEVKRIYNSQK